ncbi:hypothetical protein [Porphyromonas gulae]|uniref:hypothetical protein n=1 Tax=Porphyromonas gulae TaxID=111105 RepID=UPI0012D4B17F|nr:hypothetical protein [Porphyromonas gulae]
MKRFFRPGNPIILGRKDSESCPAKAWTKVHTQLPTNFSPTTINCPSAYTRNKPMPLRLIALAKNNEQTSVGKKEKRPYHNDCGAVSSLS